MSKGVFIEGITVEMLRNASLEAVEDLLVNGDMVDIEVQSTEWIPVSERLPENSGCVLNGTIPTNAIRTLMCMRLQKHW